MTFSGGPSPHPGGALVLAADACLHGERPTGGADGDNGSTFLPPYAMTTRTPPRPDRPKLYGYVDRVELDATALSRGVVCVRQLVGEFADGTRVSAENEGASLEREIDAASWTEGSLLEIFVAVPSLPSSHDASTDRLRRAPLILFGNEPREGHEALKVAEVVRASDGSPVLSGEYVPYCRHIGKVPWLMMQLRGLYARTATHHQALRDVERAEGGPSEVLRLLEWSAYGEFLPILEHLITYGGTDPEHAYTLLCQFAGRLSLRRVGSTRRHKFDREDLLATFRGIMDEFLRIRPLDPSPPYLHVPLESREDGLHFGRLDDDRFLHAGPFVLAVSSNQPEQVAAEQIGSLCKIASWGDIAHYQCFPLGLCGIPHPPPVIPKKPGTLYFQITQTGQLWRDILSERTIAIYLPAPYDPTSIYLELLAVVRPDLQQAMDKP